METKEMSGLFLISAIVISIILKGKIEAFNKTISELPANIFSFIASPTFIISIIILGLAVLIYRIIRHRSLRLKRERLEAERQLRKEEAAKIEKLQEKFVKKLDSDELDFEEEGSMEVDALPSQGPSKNYMRDVHIRVDPDKRYFHKKNISKDEINFLLDEDYKIKKYKNILNDKMEDFLLQPRHNESFTHLFLTHNISEFLEKKGIETELFVTRKPDIVFKIRGKKFAIEIETGTIFSKISRMKEKLEVLKDYDSWFFVVTNRNKVKKYKKYGKTVDKRYIKSRLEKLVKLAKKPKNRTPKIRV